MRIKEFSQIATKSGDSGKAADYSGNRIKKSDPLFELLGTIDETNTFIGLSYHYGHNEDLKKIQKTLERAAAQIAMDPGSKSYEKLEKLDASDVSWLEKAGQKALGETGFEAGFVLPGSDTSMTGAFYDVARTIARRCERAVWRYIETSRRKDLETITEYINRLSDYLYVLARMEKPGDTN